MKAVFSVHNVNFKSQKGFSVVEVILAAALFVILASGAISVIIQALSSNRLGAEQAVATEFASEGIEAARSIKNQSFSNLVNSAGTGIVQSGGVWAFSGSNNQFGPNNKYTRAITVSDVQRDGSGNIVANGGTLDPLTKKITSTVSWSFNPTRNNSVVLSTYLSNWIQTIVGNWANPSQQSQIDIPGASNGYKIDISGNYAYVVLNGGGTNFYVIDISSPASPSVSGSMSLVGNLRDVSVSGNYAYVASNNSSNEMQIVNISNPASPTLAGSYDAPGNATPNGVYASGTTVYLVRNSSSQDEFSILNASNPSSVTAIGSVDLGTNANALVIMGSYAYVATDSNPSELKVVNISNPSSPTVVASFNFAGNSNSISITGFGSTIITGRANSDLKIVDVSTPSSPSLLSTFAAGGAVNDISLGNNNTYAFLAENHNASDFQVVNIATLTSPTQLSSLNVTGNLNGIFYNAGQDRAYAVGDANSQEFVVLQPQ